MSAGEPERTCTTHETAPSAPGRWKELEGITWQSHRRVLDRCTGYQTDDTWTPGRTTKE
ncbi:conserved domain protein [Actinomyces sp. oral taxon 170 str. F0386]|nr:conserved domain protein [Actinomyces sp. oral taxon 170 str. F0386]